MREENQTQLHPTKTDYETRIDAFERVFGRINRGTEGYVENKAGTVAFVYEWNGSYVIPKHFVDSISHQTDKIDKYDDKSVALTSDTGSRVCLSTKYLHKIQTMTGYDFWEEPEYILMAKRNDNPVVIPDSKSDGKILVAPKILPGGW